MLRVRFAPSPTGFLHIGSARTFIFNWLYARHHGGTMILRIDDTDAGRNTEASLTSIFEGLRWLDLNWDEEYKQSERLALHRQMAETIFTKGLAYRDFTPAQGGDSEKSGAQGTWLFNAGYARISPPRKATAAPPPANPSPCASASPATPSRTCASPTASTATRPKPPPTSKTSPCCAATACRPTTWPPAPTMPTSGSADIIRGQDHLTNTFKHVLIFEAAGFAPPRFAHVPLLIAPDGTKLSKRRHGPVVSVTTYRDGGFLPQAFINFLCLLGWSPKNDRELLTRQELIDAFSLEGINRSNAVVNFTEADPFDPKAVWLNAEHIRTMPVAVLAAQLLPVVQSAGFAITPEKMLHITPLVQERIRLLRDVLTVADFFFVAELPPYDAAELIPKKGDAALALRVLESAVAALAAAEFTHDGLESALRAAAAALGIKAGQMFEPVRVAVCGRKTAPPLFGTLEVLGRETCIGRIHRAIEKLKAL